MMAGNVPQKFLNSGKSFVDILRNDANNSQLSAFCAFPEGVSFKGKEFQEDIVLIVRKDIASLIPQYFTIFLFILAPILFSVIVSGFGLSGSTINVLRFASFILFGLLTFTAVIDTFLKWFYSVGMITDQRIVDVDFHNILFHSYAEAPLEKIEDVKHKVVGLFGSVFDFGYVYVQTAGATNVFEFDNVPRPRDIQDVIYDLIELKQQGA